MTRVGHLVREDGCWIWQGSKNAKGYGRCWGGMAHRRYYEEAHGPVPEGLEIDHLCRNRACVNPAHMEVVTHQENTRRGAAAREPRFRSPVADEIRQLRRAAGLSQAQLGERMGVTGSLIGQWERGFCEPPAHRLEQVRRDLADARGPLGDEKYTTVGRAA